MMAGTSLILPPGYGYVVLTAVGTCWLSTWLGVRVGSFRKEARIVYPQVMAEQSQMAAATPEMRLKMHQFNCAQRSHHNFSSENQASFVIASLISGLRYPQATAWLGAAWLLCRVLFALGYTRSGEKDSGKGRYAGAPWLPIQIVLIGMATVAAVKMIN